MVLNTAFVPLSKLAMVLVPATLGSAVVYEYFRLSHPPVVSMSHDWIKAETDAYEHKEREAASEPVVMNPFRRMH
eukprot:jgi/Picsp_1/570/NSC_00567-R1_---NA---